MSKKFQISLMKFKSNLINLNKKKMIFFKNIWKLKTKIPI